MVLSVLVQAQSAPDARARVRSVRDLARSGDDAVPKIVPYVRDPEVEVRLEATKTLADMGGPKVLDGLVQAAQDNDPEIQIRATDGLVNIYLPGYVKTGLSGTVRRAGNQVRSRFTDINDQVIDPFVEVRPQVIDILARLVRGGAAMDARANAARAVGILRGRTALPELADALRSKDDRLMYESLVAMRKIEDPQAAPRVQFLLKDLDERVQVAALEVTGVLRNREAVVDVRDALEHARTDRVRRAATVALGQIGDPADHPRFISLLVDKDDGVRAGAAEGLGRLGVASDRAALERNFANERSLTSRLALAFAVTKLGNLDLGELAPFRYLVNALNLKLNRMVAVGYLVEIARDQKARQALYPVIARSNKEERSGLCIVLGRSGDEETLPYLTTLSKDPDPDVAAEGLRALRTLRARLP